MAQAIFFLVLGIITRMCVCQQNWTECGTLSFTLALKGKALTLVLNKLPSKLHVLNLCLCGF